MSKNKQVFRGGVQKGYIYHLTRQALQAYMDKAAELQRLHDQEVLDKALREQVEIDSGKDFQYFYTVTFYILWTKFGFRKKRMDKMYDALQEAFDNPESIEEMQRLLKEEADIEISEVNIKEASG